MNLEVHSGERSWIPDCGYSERALLSGAACGVVLALLLSSMFQCSSLEGFPKRWGWRRSTHDESEHAVNIEFSAEVAAASAMRDAGRTCRGSVVDVAEAGVPGLKRRGAAG